MFDNAERKRERLNSGLPDEITSSKYNVILGSCVIYGFLVNAIMVILLGDIAQKINYIFFLIFYFVCCIAGAIISAKSKDPTISFVGYNLIVLPIGLLLAICLPGYPLENIIAAALIAAAIAAGMMVIATIQPGWFANMGSGLFLALTIGIVVELIALLLGYRGTFFDWVFVLLFSLYTAYDWVKAQAYPKTLDNAVDSAIDIYLDIINLFLRLLSIISKKKD